MPTGLLLEIYTKNDVNKSENNNQPLVTPILDQMLTPDAQVSLKCEQLGVQIVFLMQSSY